MHFPFARDPRFGWILTLLGEGSGVTVDDEWLDVRFGPWHLRTPRSRSRPSTRSACSATQGRR